MTAGWRDDKTAPYSDRDSGDDDKPPSWMKDGIDPALSPLELRCLTLAANGRSIDDITRETDIPCERIRAAFDAAMGKLQASNLAEAIFRAARMDLI